MNFLISNGGERGHYHVEAIKPWPAFNKVKTRRAHQHDRGQRDHHQAEIAKSFHVGFGSGRPASGTARRKEADY